MTKIAKRIKERLDHNESVMDFIFCFNCYCRMMKQETSETIKKKKDSLNIFLPRRITLH